MPDTVDHFEMRRLEALSNTIFGVAMTLLAYNFPGAGPEWRAGLVHNLGRIPVAVIALLISFVFRHVLDFAPAQVGLPPSRNPPRTLS